VTAEKFGALVYGIGVNVLRQRSDRLPRRLLPIERPAGARLILSFNDVLKRNGVAPGRLILPCLSERGVSGR
jgi:hypothetical protein